MTDARPPGSCRDVEPNFRVASTWWSDLPNIWTPIGWKDHLFRFAIFWNGTLMAQPDLDRNRRAEAWKGQGVQVGFAPNCPDWEPLLGAFVRVDDNLITQGWNDCAAPVLWTDFPRDGLLMRQEVFAHIRGGGDVKTGIEPIFAWVRLSVQDVIDSLPLEKVAGFHLIIESPHLRATMEMRENLAASKEQARYPRRLKLARRHLLEPGGRVRLAIAGRSNLSSVELFQPDPTAMHYRLHLQMPARRGAHIDLLVPMLPTPRNVFDAELALGFDHAWAETNRYWAQIGRHRTRFHVPEPDINDAVRQSLRMSHLMSEKNPATGKFARVTGAWHYSNLWSTLMAMEVSWMLDPLGHHRMVERYLEIFREEQGTVVPPSNACKLHPGYLSTPSANKAKDWLSDHGAILYMLANHALLSGDQPFIREFTDCIVKACDWIKDARALRRHCGVEGVLPPAVATDKRTQIQAVWSIGWNYKGLTTAVRLLRRINHPCAAEFEREAREFRFAFVRAFRAKCRTMPRWKDARGRSHGFVPTALIGDAKEESRHGFYLDAGPLLLVFAGLFDASDPLMRDALLWFREGPPHKFYRRESNCWQVPVLDHEMSSCEPALSWNAFHSWQLGDRQRFLEGMYSQFAGTLSRKTRTACETRGGITAFANAPSTAIYLARLAVIDDQWKADELHLLRFMPLAWLEPGATARFEHMATEFGLVGLRTKVSKNGKVLEIDFTHAFRVAPRKIVVHVPPFGDLLTKVLLNGQRQAISHGQNCFTVATTLTSDRVGKKLIRKS